MKGQALSALAQYLQSADAELLQADAVELRRSYVASTAEGPLVGQTFTQFAEGRPVFKAHNEEHMRRFGAPIA